VERLLAVSYGLGYDAVVRGFGPWQALLGEVAGYVARARGPGRPAAAVRVLDVACGTGTVAARLGSEGYHVVALDGVAHLVAVARRRHRRMANVSFHHGDVARDPVPGAGTFDVVVSVHTLYWHPDPAGVLSGCLRALRPGGYALFLTYARPARVGRTFREVRAGQGTLAALRALRWLLPTAAFEAFRHYRPQYLTAGELRTALERVGFQVLEVRPTFLADLSLLAWARWSPASSAS
jgi:2-polyprenyl-6-hydroxyphenyl methylase/3-demethylubiquinone-9 3-methyltransferase